MKGKYWLTPEGSVSIAGSEHGQYVKLIMLGLAPGSSEIAEFAPIKRLYAPITPEEAQVHLGRGVDPRIVEFLSQGLDPRMWALREWGWVRTHDGIFNSWAWNDEVLDMVRSNQDYWRVQKPLIHEWSEITWNAEETGDLIRVKAQKLLTPAATAEALRHVATGVGMWRNPSFLPGDTVRVTFTDPDFEIFEGDLGEVISVGAVIMGRSAVRIRLKRNSSYKNIDSRDLQLVSRRREPGIGEIQTYKNSGMEPV